MDFDSNITNSELTIMKCLWSCSPLSCHDLLNNKDLGGWNEKSTHNKLKNLLVKKMIYIANENVSPSKKKSTNQYAPTITNAQYLESLVTSHETYKENMLPPLFQSLIGKDLQKETLDQLYTMIEKARRGNASL